MEVEQRIRPAPIVKSVQVPLAPDAAFDLFLGRMHAWWSPGHSLLKAPVKRVVVEPHAGGRWYEEGVDGSRMDWGHVERWDPPSHALLIWQLDAEFTYDPDLRTEVDLRFEAAGEGTRLDFGHRGLEAFGAQAATLRDAMDRGWGELLAAYAGQAAKRTN